MQRRRPRGAAHEFQLRPQLGLELWLVEDVFESLLLGRQPPGRVAVEQPPEYVGFFGLFWLFWLV